MTTKSIGGMMAKTDQTEAINAKMVIKVGARNSGINIRKKRDEDGSEVKVELKLYDTCFLSSSLL